MSHLIYEKKGAVATLVMNRPERRNAMSPEMIVELVDAWTDVRDDPEVRVAILTGAGDRAFCVGGDLQLLIPLLSGARAPEDEWDRRVVDDRRLVMHALLRRFDVFKPVIAAVNGVALGGGTEILQATDIRLAVPEAQFGLSEPKRGIIPAGGSLVRLARQIPWCRAMEMLLLGDPISAERAERIGLINEVFPTPDLLRRARDIADRLAENGPLALQKIKEVVARTSGLPLDDAFRIESEASREIMRTEDAREGPRAFMEKRRPAFRGK